MNSFDASPILLSLRLALVSTGLLLVIGVPLGYWLAGPFSVRRAAVEFITCLPLVLPPTVVGFYLLWALRPGWWPARIFERVAGQPPVFSFAGLVIGACVFGLPFMVQPAKAGFRALPASLREASFSLGKGHWVTFWRVLLPNARLSVLGGSVLTAAHAMGEFGVAMMVGGNIPGKTQVASTAVFNRVEAMDFAGAHREALILVAVSFAFLLVLLGSGWRRDNRNPVPG
jgi:molybdate transport system permease protein